MSTGDAEWCGVLRLLSHQYHMSEKLFILQGVRWRGNGGRWEEVRGEEGEEGGGKEVGRNERGGGRIGKGG